MKVLILWAPLADYTVASLKQLASKSEVEMHLIYHDGEPDAPYHKFDLSFCKKSFQYCDEHKDQLLKYSLNLVPDVILMSSWNYPFYMSISKACRKLGTYVVSTFDGQWLGTIKQKCAILISPFFLKPCIDNFFVPGDRQANFARKLGYKSPYQGYYSANSGRFQYLESNKNDKKFIFVGRLVPVKGIQYLMSAYRKYRTSVTDPWGLIICGKGELKSLCENQDGVEIHNFTQPHDLPKKLEGANCLILPSVFEPWGLVIHEAALAGLAIIASSSSGASTEFVKDGQNGYIVSPDEQSLLRAMKIISCSSGERLNEMYTISRTLGSLWTTEKWADYVFDNILTKSNRI